MDFLFSLASVKNRKLRRCPVIHNLRRSVCIHDLACTFRVVLPIAKPAFELLRLCNIFYGHIDFCIKLAYNTIRRSYGFQLFGELYPGI